MGTLEVFKYLRRCWWRYGGHYGSDMTTVASTAFDVDVCRLKSRSMTMKNNKMTLCLVTRRGLLRT